MADPYVRKVRYWDVDANGHVFNARFFVYIDDAMTDFFEAAGLEFGTHADRGVLAVAAHAECDFLGEAVIGDVLETTVSVIRVGTTSLTFGFQVTKAGTAEIVASGNEVYVTVDLESRRPRPIPDDWREKLTAPSA